MPGRKKKFIDKKNAVTFHLVHRSQRDPLQADEEAPEHVLLQATETESTEVRKEEQRKYGVFFDDDYDYLQHLKEVNELSDVQPGEYVFSDKTQAQPESISTVADALEDGPKLQLPSSVFGSEMETEVGLLNRAAPDRDPKLDWDPDIVAALDDDFDFDDPQNELDDNFVQFANEGAENQKENMDNRYIDSDDDGDEDDFASDEADLSEGDSDIGSLERHSFDEEETKSRFTNYSMTSSVIRRNQGLTLLDDRFEKMYEQYEDDEIGALDHEDIEGCIAPNSELLSNVMEEFEKQQKQTKLKDAVQPAEEADVESETESEEEDLIKVVEEPKEKWDCESILSTYSNLYNHPRKIEEPKKQGGIKLSKKAGIPIGALPQKGPSLKQIERAAHGADGEDRACTYRPRDEDAEERRARKKAVKEERKARREEKKANKTAFKNEKKRQEKEHLNVLKNFQGVKIV